MNDSFSFVAVLLVAAVVPFAFLGAVRLAARAAPAYCRWATGFERQHRTRLWMLMATMYLLMGAGYFVTKNPEPAFVGLFAVMGLASIVKAVRRRRSQTVTADQSRSA
jgi:hypothetical protein